MDLRSAGRRSSGEFRASRRSTQPSRWSSRKPARHKMATAERRLRWRCGRSWNGGRVFLLNARITALREVAKGMFVIAMEAPEIAASVRAGQFVNLGWAGVFLRRPFSVYRADGERIEVVLKAVGRGTAQLLAMRTGGALSCLGPLGHGFDLVAGPHSAVLGSGGLGVAAMPL